MRSRGPVVLVGVLLAFLGACGQSGDESSDDAGGAPPSDGAGGAAATSLTIEVRTDEEADPTTMTLTCDPVGGDHPQAQEACDALAAAGAEVLEPVPDDQPCTMIYGGPQTATVKGTFEGADVDASFSRQDGCELDRWDRLGTTFFDVPLQ